MTLSVIIATMNRPDDLEKALRSVFNQTRLPEELWIIDQSTDAKSKDLVAMLTKEFASTRARLHYVTQEEKSLVKARNRGIDLAQGDIVSFLDDDIVLDGDYFEKIMRVFEKDTQVVALSGNARVREAWFGWKWRLRQALHHLFLINHYDGRMTWSGFGHPIYEREIDRVHEVEFLPGCNMNYRRDALKGERFDEFFVGYSYREDAEFSYRISKKGRVRMLPDAKLWHNYSTSNRLTEAQLKTMKIKNYAYMFRKFKGKNPVAKLLFAYSLLGLTVIDAVEYFTGRDRSKWDKLKAGIDASKALLGKHD